MAGQIVWVTGIGAVSCLGTDVPHFWDALCEGKCGLRPIERSGPAGDTNRIAGQVSGFDLELFENCGLSQGAQYALGAASEALAGFPPERLASLAFAVGTLLGPPGGVGGASAAAGADPRGAEARRLAQALGAGGAVACISPCCPSGAAAIAYAFDLIRAGRTEAALACGYDGISPETWVALATLDVTAVPEGDSAARVRPFDERRSGALFSEGAGCLLLESLRGAEQRGVEPLAEVAGAAVGSGPSPEGAEQRAAALAAVMRRALEDADLPPEGIGHVNADGAGTRRGDLAEAHALEEVFGQRVSKMPVASLKGGLGHALGAAGALEAVASVMTLRTGTIPPTVNHGRTDAAIRLDVVHGAARQSDSEAALSVSVGFGGSSAAVVLRRPVGAASVL
ncbi:MAG: beta-ketoacyl-[acyl-carrier-protein] synthase family protein [Planctomycetota bacterium]